MADTCEYCGRDDVVLYAWHADVWCAGCIATAGRSLVLEGSVDDAPLGRQTTTSYAQPFMWQTPDGRVTHGQVGEAADV